MTIQRTRGKSDKNGIALLINNTTSSHSHLDANTERKIVNIGGGFGSTQESFGPGFYTSSWGALGSWNGRSGMGLNYGDWTLIPTRTFEAEVKMWGAGGGAHSHGGDAYGGGGGFAKSQITFIEGIPYTLWVGQGGFYAEYRYGGNGNRRNYRTSGTFGNGGGAGHNGGSGGGMSGIFFNTLGNDGGPGAGHGNLNTGEDGGGVSTWFRSPSQNNALLISGGGGGAGHTTYSSHHGQAGGGGGTTGNHGHANGGGTQTAGGGHWTNDAQSGYQMHGGHSSTGSQAGGGGGGWYGGGGGAHYSSHYNGGGGGSGHAIDLNSIAGFPNFWIKQRYGDIARGSYIETSPSQHGSANVNMAAGRNQSDWGYAGIGAGAAQVSNNLNTMKYLGTHGNLRDGTNGRVVIKVVD